MANGEIVHLKQTSESICPRNPLERALRGTYFGNVPRCTLLFQRICFISVKPLPRHWRNCLLLLNKGTNRAPLSLKSNWSFTPTPSFGSTDSWLSSRGTVPLTLSSDSNKQGAKADPAKQEESSENDVDALTFMQTVIMSFVRGLTHGEQTLPINDLFVYLPVQLLPALVESILHHGFDRAEVKSGWGY